MPMNAILTLLKARALPLLLAIALALLLARPAEAHANLLRSDPAAGALLDRSPPSIRLEFSEELDAAFSQAQLFDSQNRLVEPGPGAVDPATLPPPALDTLARWLNLIAAALALGGLPFGLLVWRPAFRAATKDEGRKTKDHGQSAMENVGLWSLVFGLEAADQAITRFLQRTMALGGLLFVLTNLFFLITQAAAAANVPLAQAIGAPALELLSGRSGLLWLARLALTVQIVVLAWRLPPAGRGAARLWWALLAIGAVVVLTLSLLSHAAASPAAAIAVPLDWMHLVAMIAWLGGLIPLSFAISTVARAPDQAVPLALLIPRFSRLTIACVTVLTLTGIYNYALQVGALDLLAATTYGRTLLISSGCSARCCSWAG